MAEHLRPVVQHRIDQEKISGSKWEGKPVGFISHFKTITILPILKIIFIRKNDLLMWMLEEAERIGIERTPLDMATRLYFLAFASHATSTVRVSALSL
jgi:hypothetical protein